MSNTALRTVMGIESRLRRQRDELKKSVRKLEDDVDSKALRLKFKDSSRAKDELRRRKDELRNVEKKCSECSLWVREANSSDPKKQENALKRAQRL